MKATKHEMVFVKFTKAELTELLMGAVMDKYPYLLDTEQYDWEDFFIAKDVHQNAFKDTDVAVELTFTKQEEAVKSIDEQDKAVYISINEVCR